jgi:cation/acetate symporter
MSAQNWTYLIVGLSFALYIGIAWWSRAANTKEFYVAGKGVNPIANGMATAADWMSAASFLSMAGMVAVMGRDGAAYLMGWTGGYVLLALLLAPYLRKFGKFTVPDFIGDRYYSSAARMVAVVCALFVSFTYVAGQMRGVGIVFSRFLGVEIETGVVVGMAIVFFYATLGGMKGITYTQVAQYCVLIFAYLVPAIFISIMLTGNPLPQAGMLGTATDSGRPLLEALDGLSTELGFRAYSEGGMGTLNKLCLTIVLMAGTAGLPHVIVRFYTVRRVKDARSSAFWALLLIALLYTTAPAIAIFARTNLLQTVPGKEYALQPAWFKSWETTGLIAWQDKNGDGKVQVGPGPVFEAMPGQRKALPVFSKSAGRGPSGERLLDNPPAAGPNELYVDNDIIVLANPEIARLPNWVIGLVAAGGLAAALSTAAGLLLVISTSFAHDLVKRTMNPGITERGELLCARVAAGGAVVLAGYFGVNPPGFVAEIVALAFGLAASSFFPVIVLGIFSKRMNREGAIAGMVAGLGFTVGAILLLRFDLPLPFVREQPKDLFGISAEGIGTVGMLVNFAVALVVSRLTPPPPPEVVAMVESIRIPAGAGEAHDH